jgi:GTP cyclohydrolase I
VIVDSEAIKRATHDILVAVGEDPNRDGLIGTPDRVATLLEELYSGVGVDPMSVISEAAQVITTPEERGDRVALRDISFSSVCEHHLLPFSGVASVVYQPGEGVLGLGTIARLVEVVSRRPQIQERLGDMVAKTLVASGIATGALVLISAIHGCVVHRGPRQQVTTVTVAAEGTLKQGPDRHEALLLVGGEDWAGE